MKNIKIAVKPVTEEGLKELAAFTKGRIKQYIARKVTPFTLLSTLKKDLNIPNKFFEFRHVCMNCGDVQEMGTYAIAQTAMGHKVNYTCDCGHVTTLPQS